MENTDKFILRFYLALFCSVISHSIILLLLFALVPSFELQKKTIPFQLLSYDRQGAHSGLAELSKTENTLAAQEFLRTLNESSFEKLIKENTGKASQHKESPFPFKKAPSIDTSYISKPIFLHNSSSSSAIQGLQDIFSHKVIKQDPANNKQQITTKSLEQLNQYEIQLLQKLAKDELYDEFHPVMSKNKQTHLNYIISLNLFANGAIKSATIIQSSNIYEIDQLAIKAAYQASPFPKPPPEDINRGFKYNIPIIYQKETQTKKELNN